ncbi:MAG: hypothetical protein ABS76_33845 [Pelagibacterium sp. SCN 64-44]|nr:MAG: hypothetical protein ABS76_33845 [Pelagibacterium sp. SCN 64-44]
MLRFLRPFKEADADADFYLRWIGNAQAMHGAVFGYIEALIVLAALQFAAQQFGGAVIWSIYVVAWFAHLLLTTVYVRVMAAFAASRFPVQGTARNALFWMLGGISLMASVWLVGAYSVVIDAVIVAGLGS